MTKPNPLLLTLALIVLLAPVLRGQTPLELRELETVEVVPEQRANGFLEPIKCDSDSNIYYQTSQNEKNPFLNPVARISADGKAFIFPLPHPDHSTSAMQVADFAPTTGGGVALLLTTTSGKEPYVRMFGGAGRQISSLNLPNDIKALQIAASPLGKIFISGWLLSPPDSGQARIPFAGVFDGTGRLVTQYPLRGAEPVPFNTPEYRPEYTKSVDLSYAEALNNESFVLARLQTVGGPIHILSTARPNLVNRFLPPLPTGTVVSSVKVDGNTLAVMSIRKTPNSNQNEISDVYISVWDLGTNTPLGQYHHASPRLGSALACYKRGVFTFLTSGPNSEVQLVRAAGLQ